MASTGRVPSSLFSKKILHWANVCFSAHAIAQSYIHTISEPFQAARGLCDIYAIIDLECYKRARIRISLRKWSGGTGQLRIFRGNIGSIWFVDVFDAYLLVRATRMLGSVLNFNLLFKEILSFLAVKTQTFVDISSLTQSVISADPILFFTVKCFSGANTGDKRGYLRMWFMSLIH